MGTTPEVTADDTVGFEDRARRVLVVDGTGELARGLDADSSRVEVCVATDDDTARAEVAGAHRDAYLVHDRFVKLCRTIRTLRTDGAIIVYGDADTVAIRRAALHGADEYLAAPVAAPQLVASIVFHAARRRARQQTRERGPFIVDPSLPGAWVFRRWASLTDEQVEVLVALIDAEGPLSRPRTRQVLGYEDKAPESGSRNQLDMMMNRLRDRLDAAAPERHASDWIQTLDGRGFQLADPDVAALLGILSRRARRQRASSMPPRKVSGEIRIGERAEAAKEVAPRPAARCGKKR